MERRKFLGKLLQVVGVTAVGKKIVDKLPIEQEVVTIGSHSLELENGLLKGEGLYSQISNQTSCYIYTGKLGMEQLNEVIDNLITEQYGYSTKNSKDSRRLRRNKRNR